MKVKKKLIEDKIKEIIQFIEVNDNGKKEEYEEKEKELKAIADPVIAKLYQSSSGAEQNGGMPDVGTGSTNEPKIEEVD